MHIARIVALRHPTRIQIRRVIAQSHVLDQELERGRKRVKRMSRAVNQDLVHGLREVLVLNLEATDASLVRHLLVPHHDLLGAHIQDLVEKRFVGDLTRPVPAPNHPFCIRVEVFSSRGSGRRVKAVVKMEGDEGKLLGVGALESSVTWNGTCIYHPFPTCTSACGVMLESSIVI